jgi:hypothetical protein
MYDMIRYRKDIENPKKVKNKVINASLLILYLVIKLFSLEKKRDDFYSGFILILSKI